MRPADDRDARHRLYHERRYMFCAALILVDLCLVPFAQVAYGDPQAAVIFLLPALPVALAAVADWIASGRSPATCTCKWNFNRKG